MKSFTTPSPWIAAALSAALTALPALAQRTTGTLSGAITDESGGALPGTEVILRGEAVMGVQHATCNEEGLYRFTSLPPGSYDLQFALAGFKTVERRGVRVQVGATAEVDQSLAVSNLADEITVEADAAVVDATSSEVGTNFGRNWVDNATLARYSFHDVVGGTPGTLQAGEGSQASQVYGSSADENVYQLDGTDVTDNFFSAASAQPSVDSIEEVEVLSLGAPAEYGNLTGAVVNIVTRQGGNAFHGAASYYNQPSALTDRNTTPEQDQGFPFEREQYHDVSAQLGGPLVKDKLWLFGSYQFQRDQAVDVLQDPSFANPPETNHRYMAKLNWQLSAEHRLQATLSQDERSQAYTPYANSAPSTATIHRESTPTPGVAYTGTLSPRTTLDVRYGGFYGSRSTYPLDPNQPPGLTHFLDLDTGYASGGSYFYYDLDVDRTTVSAKLSHYADHFLGGSHDFRFGVQYTDANAGGLYGYNDVVYTYGTAYGATGYGYDRSPFGYNGNTRGVAVFGDDTWKLGDRVSLNLGLRFDRNKAFSKAQDQIDGEGRPTGITFPQVDYYTWKTLSPRIGFNLKLTADGRTALKGHYGRYHRGIATAEYANILGPSITPSYFGTYDLATNTFVDPVLISSADNLSIDPGYTSPYTDQLIVSFERELARDIGASLTYVHKRGRNYASWLDHGGVYTPVNYVDDQGQAASGGTIVLQQLQNGLDELSYEITNRPEMKTDIDAVTLSVTKRAAGRLQLNASLSYLRASGRIAQSDNGSYSYQGGGLQFNTFGRDPNDFLNTGGRLPTDVPWVGKVQAVYKLPAEFLLGVNYFYRTGANRVRQLRVGDFTNLPSLILAQERGTFGRLPGAHFLDLRLSKDFKLGSHAVLGLSVDCFNVLNIDTYEYTLTDLATSEGFQERYGAVLPRRAMLGARLRF